MTPQELRASVVSTCSAELRASRNTAAIAAKMSEGRKRHVTTLIGFGTVLDVLGADEGAAVLDALESAAQQISKIKWAMRLLDGSKLDVGLESTRTAIDELVGQIFTQAQADTLKSLADVHDPIPELDVVKACYSDSGKEWLV
jgi:hypothetical protein